MKILYKKKRDFMTLISSILWGIFAVNGIWKGEMNTFEYLALFCSIAYLLYFLFDKKEYYLTIKNGVLQTGKLLKKKIKLSEIERIIEKENKIILKNNKSELTIETEIIDSESLSEFKSELKKLNVEWN
jgi:hypothetical protein